MVTKRVGYESENSNILRIGPKERDSLGKLFRKETSLFSAKI